ncbi:P-type DNA transfer ATPase VirB11 [Peristeroidobacter soli]|uniref:P-type DNA transfer ATPase VirB11 n=1 Tax=Peristeroidobacter soli TaxID=2497877 RepID=UPI001C379A9F|nr:P-type DNA transfer ATPase VirB11 [Peristeroidobacter soli]
MTLRPLAPWLSQPDVTEICINRPGELFVESSSGWRREALPIATFDWCMRLAKLVAHATHQRIAEDAPLLSATLPGGERIQIVLPPAVASGTVTMAIRRSPPSTWSLEELGAQGLFRRTRSACGSLDSSEETLMRLLADRDYEQFLRFAVQTRRNIVVSGATGTGKTTFTRALISDISVHERLITIEDAAELTLDRHPNHVRLFYSKGGQSGASVTPKQLLECSLRLRPDRILLAELRAEEAWDYVRSVASGHPGSITSIHASSATLAFEQLTLLVQQSRAGAALEPGDIKRLLYQLVDVVVQFGRSGGDRYISEVWYEPARKRSQDYRA